MWNKDRTRRYLEDRLAVLEGRVDEIERMGRLKRFLPSAVADAVVSSGSDKMLQSHRALLGSRLLAVGLAQAPHGN